MSDIYHTDGSDFWRTDYDTAVRAEARARDAMCAALDDMAPARGIATAVLLSVAFGVVVLVLAAWVRGML